MSRRGASYFTWIAFGVIVILLFFSAYLFYDHYQSYPSPLDSTIEATFTYDSDPEVGLTVNLYDSGDVLADGPEVTDGSGIVTFAVTSDDTYTMKWTWGGDPGSQAVVVDSSASLFEEDVALASKSGRGIVYAG